MWLSAIMSDRKPQDQDKFIIRLPKGMRSRIKRAADANGRSMNAEVVAALLDWFPDPTAEEYLAWLHRELEALRGVVQSTRAPDEQKALASKAMAEVRQKIIDLIDGKSDPATFEEEIARLSDFHATKSENGRR